MTDEQKIEKLRDELAEAHPYHQRGSFIGVKGAFVAGWNAVRANPDPRVAELVEAGRVLIDELKLKGPFTEALRKFERGGT